MCDVIKIKFRRTIQPIYIIKFLYCCSFPWLYINFAETWWVTQCVVVKSALESNQCLNQCTGPTCTRFWRRAWPRLKTIGSKLKHLIFRQSIQGRRRKSNHPLTSRLLNLIQSDEENRGASSVSYRSSPGVVSAANTCGQKYANWAEIWNSDKENVENANSCDNSCDAQTFGTCVCKEQLLCKINSHHSLHTRGINYLPKPNLNLPQE